MARFLNPHEDSVSTLIDHGPHMEVLIAVDANDLYRLQEIMELPSSFASAVDKALAFMEDSVKVEF